MWLLMSLWSPSPILISVPTKREAREEAHEVTSNWEGLLGFYSTVVPSGQPLEGLV